MQAIHIKSLLGAASLALGLTAAGQATAADTAICYNCPPEWADWASQLEAIQEETGIRVPPDNKNSGQTLAALVSEQSNPVADVAYYGVSFGIQAAEQELVQPYRPEHWEDIPEGLKDPQGAWFAIHSGTLGFMVNEAALGDLPVPQTWEDLLDPRYDGMVGYLDPSSAFVGYVGAVSINLAMGGSLDDFDPAIEFFQNLQDNNPIVPKQTAYARVLSGEIPILLDYDFNAYRARYDDDAPVRFVIPEEGTITVPYVMSLVADAPHEQNGKRVLDFVLSDQGQAIWANAYLRPVRESAISAEAQEKFLPATEYERAETVDYAHMAEVQRDFAERYQGEVN